jgi:hypothetical protein
VVKGTSRQSLRERRTAPANRILRIIAMEHPKTWAACRSSAKRTIEEQIDVRYNAQREIDKVKQR